MTAGGSSLSRLLGLDVATQGQAGAGLTLQLDERVDEMRRNRKYGAYPSEGGAAVGGMSQVSQWLAKNI